MGAAKNTVLFVDDESHILSAIRRAVADEDFEAVFAGSGREALQIFEERSVSVIVTDMRMPGMDGLTLLKAIREKYPKTVRMVLSGYTQLSQVLATINQGDIFQFIAKPWEREEELLGAVRQAIDRFNLEAERDSLQVGLAKKNQAYLKIFREMEQKLANEKKDLINIKRINHWIFSFWKKQLEIGAACSVEGKDALPGYVDLIEEIQLMYIDILPTVSEVKSSAKAVADITKVCADRIVINNPGSADTLLSGYYGFLHMAFKLLVYICAADPKTVLFCDMALNSKDEKNVMVTFDIKLQLLKLPASDQSRLKVGCSLLSEMGRIYGVLVTPEISGSETSSLQLTWHTAGGS